MAYQDEINLLYQQIFGRNADDGGLAYWADKLAQGIPLEQVAGNIVAAAPGAYAAYQADPTAYAAASPYAASLLAGDIEDVNRGATTAKPMLNDFLSQANTLLQQQPTTTQADSTQQPPQAGGNDVTTTQNTAPQNIDGLTALRMATAMYAATPGATQNPSSSDLMYWAQRIQQNPDGALQEFAGTVDAMTTPIPIVSNSGPHGTNDLFYAMNGGNAPDAAAGNPSTLPGWAQGSGEGATYARPSNWQSLDPYGFMWQVTGEDGQARYWVGQNAQVQDPLDARRLLMLSAPDASWTPEYGAFQGGMESQGNPIGYWLPEGTTDPYASLRLASVDPNAGGTWLDNMMQSLGPFGPILAAVGMGLPADIAASIAANDTAAATAAMEAWAGAGGAGSQALDPLAWQSVVSPGDIIANDLALFGNEGALNAVDSLLYNVGGTSGLPGFDPNIFLQDLADFGGSGAWSYIDSLAGPAGGINSLLTNPGFVWPTTTGGLPPTSGTPTTPPGTPGTPGTPGAPTTPTTTPRPPTTTPTNSQWWNPTTWSPSTIGSVAGGLLGSGLLGGGAKEAGKITTVTEPWDKQQPYLLDLFAGAKNALGSAANISPSESAALTGMEARARTGSPLTNTAKTQYQNLLSGNLKNPMLGLDNPFLTNAIDLASQDVTRNYNLAMRPQTDANFARQGAFGGSAWQEMTAENNRQLAQELGRVSSNMRMQDYTQQQGLQENQLNRQTQAIYGAPAFAQQDYNDLDRLYQAGQTRRYDPFKTLGQYQGLVQGGYGNSQTQPYFNNPMSNILGGALTGGLLGNMFK